MKNKVFRAQFCNVEFYAAAGNCLIDCEIFFQMPKSQLEKEERDEKERFLKQKSDRNYRKDKEMVFVDMKRYFP